MFFKIHNSYRDVVAICDSELIGKTFQEGNLQLEVKENFFKGEKADKEKIKEIIEKFSMQDATFNIVGEKAVAIAIKSGLISKENTKNIEGIPFALALL